MARIQTCYPGIYAGGFILIRESEVGGVIARGLLANGAGANVSASDLPELRERLDSADVQPLCYFSAELEKHAQDNGWLYDGAHPVVVVPRENYAKLGAAILGMETAVGRLAGPLLERAQPPALPETSNANPDEENTKS